MFLEFLTVSNNSGRAMSYGNCWRKHFIYILFLLSLTTASDIPTSRKKMFFIMYIFIQLIIVSKVPYSNINHRMCLLMNSICILKKLKTQIFLSHQIHCNLIFFLNGVWLILLDWKLLCGRSNFSRTWFKLWE